MDFTIDIASPIERVFALIADLANYPRWLPPSGLYGATTEVSATPVALGTTYEDGKQAKLHGRVTDFRPPVAIAFHQEARLLFSRLSIDIVYGLEPLGAGTRVYRTTTPRLSGLLAPLGPVVARSIRAENLRTLAMMKHYLERDAEREGGA
jgi:uncharacterized protein YndB with AHSA1/START domain